LCFSRSSFSTAARWELMASINLSFGTGNQYLKIVLTRDARILT
jgi:hypothetical protein